MNGLILSITTIAAMISISFQSEHRFINSTIISDEFQKDFQTQNIYKKEVKIASNSIPTDKDQLINQFHRIITETAQPSSFQAENPDVVNQQEQIPPSNTNESETTSTDEFLRVILFACGIFLAVIGIGLTWKNEKHYIHFQRKIDFAQLRCKTTDFCEGDMVFLSGKVHYMYNLADPLFNLSIEKAVKISREIEMVQYEEKKSLERSQNQNQGGDEEFITQKALSSPTKIRQSYQRGKSTNEYEKRWLGYRVPILNFKDQDKIQKSQKYCKFIAETDSFEMSKISLPAPLSSQHCNKQMLSKNNSASKLGGAQIGSGLQNHQSDHYSSSNSLHGQNTKSLVYIKDYSLFDEFPVQSFQYNLLTPQEKDIITSKIEELRRLQVTFSEFEYDSYVQFKDKEVIISRKNNSKMHLGDNRMSHYYVFADNISVLGKLNSSFTLIPCYLVEDNDEDIELQDLNRSSDNINMHTQNNNYHMNILNDNQESLIFPKKLYSDTRYYSSPHNQRINGNKNSMWSLSKLSKRLFTFDDRIYWGLDRISTLKEFLQIKRAQFVKRVRLFRVIAFIILYISVFIAVLPLLHFFNLVGYGNQQFPIEDIALLSAPFSFIILLATAFPAYAVYKLSHAGVILILMCLTFFFISEIQ